MSESAHPVPEPSLAALIQSPLLSLSQRLHCLISRSFEVCRTLRRPFRTSHGTSISWRWHGSPGWQRIHDHDVQVCPELLERCRSNVVTSELSFLRHERHR